MKCVNEHGVVAEFTVRKSLFSWTCKWNEFVKIAKKLKTSETSTEYDQALDEIEGFVEKDKKNRKYIYNWLAYWDQRRHHFSRAWKQAGAPSTNLSESFNSRHVHTNDVKQKLIDAAKSDTVHALSLDRYLTKYAEGGKKIKELKTFVLPRISPSRGKERQRTQRMMRSVRREERDGGNKGATGPNANVAEKVRSLSVPFR